LKHLLSLLLSTSLFAYQFVDLSAKEDIFTHYKEYNLQKKFSSLDEDLHKDYVVKDINLNNQLDQREKRLFNDTMYLQVFMIGTIGVLAAMPTSVTNWDNAGERDLGQQWLDNVKAGPVWDEDDFFINYIGHPVSGAWYYMIAREDGYGVWESFFYSFFLSTFFWEYGYEAFAEIPSTQDLIFTPTVGALFGEGFWYMQNALDANRGVLLGSKILGNIAYFLLNPIKRITSSMDSFIDADIEFHYQVFQPPTLTHVSPYLRNIDYVPSNYGFIIDIKF
jgi:hypothetical protein